VVSDAAILVEETLFIDDFEQNIAAARKFGFHTYHYTTGNDLAGFLDQGVQRNRGLRVS